MSSLKRAYPEGEVDEHKESGNDAAAGGCSGRGSAAAAAAAAAVAAPAKRPRVEAAEAGGPASSSLLPPRPDLPECKLCNHAFESSEKSGDESSGRLPRLLPCGHCYCSKCIETMLQRSNNVVSCPQRCAFKQQLRVDSVADLPKNWALIESLEQTALFAARVELGAPPCKQCDPSQPRRVATIYCDSCASYLCAEHDKSLHAVPALANHTLVSLAEKVQQQLAASQSDRLLEEAAAPLKVLLQDCLTQLGDSDAQSQELIPTLEQKHRDHSARQESVAKKLRAFAAAMKRKFEQQREVLKSGRDDLVERQLKIAPLQAEINALLQGSDLDVTTSAEALCQRAESLLQHLQTATLQTEPAKDNCSPRLMSVVQLELLGSTILQHSDADVMSQYFGDSLEGAKLLYRASRDGFDAADLWKRCARKGPTLILVKVAGNGFVFGVYTPAHWPAKAASEIIWVADPSGGTFLFSLVNAHGRAMKLRLRDNRREDAINLEGYGNGPGFGRGPDLRLMSGKAADKPQGCFFSPGSFELEAEAAAGLPPIPSICDKTLLAGADDEKGLGYFAAAEIEVYQL